MMRKPTRSIVEKVFGFGFRVFAEQSHFQSCEGPACVCTCTERTVMQPPPRTPTAHLYIIFLSTTLSWQLMYKSKACLPHKVLGWCVHAVTRASSGANMLLTAERPPSLSLSLCPGVPRGLFAAFRGTV